ncbi:MAG: hypothetical protein H7A33_05550 [Deltaproteobacteria bacterium]|nr:hypothetical protein [Deltaproteobacteria bacterium]
MKLLDKLDRWAHQKHESHKSEEAVLNHKLAAELHRLSVFKSTKEIENSNAFQAMKDEILKIIYGYEFGRYAETKKEKPRDFRRAVLWYLEHGKNFEGILETMRNRALVSQADLYFLPAVDIGLERTDNLNVVRSLALELSYNYYFATSFVHLNDIDKDGQISPNNRVAIEGNAILSKYPLRNLRSFALPNFRDPASENPKRIGCEKVVLADVAFPEGDVTAVCVNLPDFSSQRQRFLHMRQISRKLREMVRNKPVLIGGDLKTSTYNCRNDWMFFFSVANKVFRGYDYIVNEHHCRPDQHFDRRLFHYLERKDWHFKDLNEESRGSFHAKPIDLIRDLGDGFAAKLIKKLLKDHEEKISLKNDWFMGSPQIVASSSPQAERPKVISHLFYEGRPVSSHDPILLDFELKSPR